MRKEFEEKEVVVIDDEGDMSSNQEEMRWDNFLPKGSMTVLLVEGDDSTRQIVAALLRKCNYKVIAMANGTKAWEILKERAHSIDIVLAEVEAPSLSGISLLSNVMDHDTCKNIPVIMMSSNDSVNMVLKCMLKGAADFLIKPLRKNELRNLWQHVWRRYVVTHSHGDTNVHRCDDQVKQKHKDDSQRGNRLDDRKECSEKGSDAESFCTRADMEAESAYQDNSRELQQQKSREFSLSHVTICQNEDEDVEQRELPSKQVIDLIGRIDDQRECSFEDTGNNFFDPREAFNSSCIPLLELSLRGSDSVNGEKNECSTLHHSDSSAFSLYNGRVGTSYLLTAANFQAEFENYMVSQIQPANFEAKDGVIKCSPRRVTPASVPVGGINFDREKQPVIFRNSFPLWSTNEAIRLNTSCQSGNRDHCSSQSFQSHLKSPTTPAQMEDVSVELRDEAKHVENTSHFNSNMVQKISSMNNGSFSAANAREAALNKFRLKRKERCFEKKVRYQSRKRLAEQRPRVKGQFVRHIQPEAHSIGADSQR